jgi:hypothetical protein
MWSFFTFSPLVPVIQLTAGEPALVFHENGSSFLGRIFRTTYKQAANMHAAGAEFSMFDPRNFVFWRGDRLRNGHTMVQWCGQLQPKG